MKVFLFMLALVAAVMVMWTLYFVGMILTFDLNHWVLGPSLILLDFSSFFTLVYLSIERFA